VCSGKAPFFLAASILLGAARAQSTEDILLIDPACVCVKTRSETESVSAKEVRSGDGIWQAFFDKKTGKEVFRVEIGRRLNGEDLKFWNYGLVVQRDFNGDGIDDFSWFGGDDSSKAEYLLLSSSTGFRKIDVYATLAAEYARQLKTDPPDLKEIGVDFEIRDEKIETNRGNAILTATVIDSRDIRKPRTTALRVKFVDFVTAKR
jgi:hypothetical protein